MIEVIASLLLTPAAIATPPPNVPAIVQTYDWKTQGMNVPTAGTDAANLGLGTWSARYSYVGSTYSIDGWMSD